MFCSQCGHDNLDDAKFCTECGARLLDSSSARYPEDAPTDISDSQPDSPLPIDSITDFETEATMMLPGVEETDRYEILGKLGKGGMGVVYKARDKRLDRLVALKRLKIANPSRRNMQRLLGEAKTLAGMRHHNICQIYDIGHDLEGWYIAMEHLDAGTLSDRIEKEGTMDSDATVRIIRALADGLRHAHAGGVIHRDIKPKNVLFRHGKEPVLTDFGIAKAGESDFTMTGVAMGSPYYMAPEQREDAKHVDARADIYSLGGTMYKMLTGHYPVALEMKLIPPRLRSIVLKCLQTKPAKRYESCEELIVALDRVRGPRIGMKAAAALLLVGLAIAIAAAAVKFNQTPPYEPAAPEPAESKTDPKPPQPKPEPKASPVDPEALGDKEPKPEPKPEPPVLVPAAMTISSKVPAAIWEGPRLLGKTGESIEGLAPGVHSFTLKSRDFADADMEVALDSAGRHRLEAPAMVPLTSELKIDARMVADYSAYSLRLPTYAEVKIGLGDWKMVDLPYRQKLPIGKTYVISLRMDNYESVEPRKLKVSDQKARQVAFAMVPEPVSLSITANIEGAAVYRGGKWIGKTDADIEIMPFKFDQLEVRADGYGSQTVDVKLGLPGERRDAYVVQMERLTTSLAVLALPTGGMKLKPEKMQIIIDGKDHGLQKLPYRVKSIDVGTHRVQLLGAAWKDTTVRKLLLTADRAGKVEFAVVPKPGLFRFETKPSDAVLSVGGIVVSADTRAAEPGKIYKLKVTKDGYVTETHDISTGPGETKTIKVSLDKKRSTKGPGFIIPP